MVKVSCDNCGRYTNGTVRDNRELCEDCYFWHYPPCSICGENKPVDDTTSDYLGNSYLSICDSCQNLQKGNPFHCNKCGYVHTLVLDGNNDIHCVCDCKHEGNHCPVCHYVYRLPTDSNGVEHQICKCTRYKESQS